eukprot:s505_g6.t1
MAASSAPPIPVKLLTLDLQSDNPRKRMEAGLAVAKQAALGSRNQVTLIDGGVVEPLVRQLKDGDGSFGWREGHGDERVEAATALARLAKDNPTGQFAAWQQRRKEIVVAGAVMPLRKQLMAQTALQRVSAATCISRLSEGNPETQRAFAVEGTARPLLALLDAATMEERVHAAVALGHLATENPENQARAGEAWRPRTPRMPRMPWMLLTLLTRRKMKLDRPDGRSRRKSRSAPSLAVFGGSAEPGVNTFVCLASWSGFRNASVALIGVANLSVTAAAEQASFMDPLAQLPTLLQSQLEASAELQAWLEENRIWEGHRCLFCESAKLDLGNYSALLQLGVAGQAAQQLVRGTLAQSEAEVLAENASAQGVALEEVSNALDNISSHLEASTHTWRATADWMPWAVGLLSSFIGVTALCSAIAACWVASQPSRLEVLGCVVNDAARDHAQISRVAWGGPETETGDLEDFRVLRITSAAWYSAGLMTVAMLTGSAFTTIFALVLQDLSTVNPGAVLNTQVSTSEPAFAEGVLMTCFAGQGFAWPSFSTEAAAWQRLRSLGESIPIQCRGWTPIGVFTALMFRKRVVHHLFAPFHRKIGLWLCKLQVPMVREVDGRVSPAHRKLDDAAFELHLAHMETRLRAAVTELVEPTVQKMTVLASEVEHLTTSVSRHMKEL